jgi:hypothetical protein
MGQSPDFNAQVCVRVSSSFPVARIAEEAEECVVQRAPNRAAFGG